MSFVEVSDELEWASQLMGAMDYEQGFLNNFTTRANLGRGTFGKVFWARSTRDGKRWTSAVKLMESQSEKDDEECLAYWAQESHIWRTLCPHPNILQLHEVYYGKVETRQKIAMSSCTTLALTWRMPVFGRRTCAPASGTCIHVI